jgi:hypothetical protein
MNRSLELVVLALGGIVVFYGISTAFRSLGTDLSLWSGLNPSDRSVWALWVGIASITFGGLMSISSLGKQ